MPAQRREQWATQWDNRRSHSRPRYQGKGGAGEAFFWKCGACANVQTGSECKGCRTKYWHLPSWERVAKPEHSVKWNLPAGDTKNSPAGAAQPHQALAEVIHNLVNPIAGEPPSDPNIIQLAQTLQKQLLSKCTIEEKHRRLQSVMSKMEHNQKMLTKSQEQEAKLQEELRTLQEERLGLIKKNEDLEAERQELLKVVHGTESAHPPHPDNPYQGMASGSDADSEAESDTLDRPTKRTKSQGRTAPHQRPWCTTHPNPLSPVPDQWAQDIAGMAPQVLQHLQHLLHTESQRRAQPGPQQQANHNRAAEEHHNPGFGDLSAPGAALG